MKKSIFKASFEESLNLEDDGLVQYQNKDVFSRVEAYYKQGKPTIKLRLQSILLTLVGPIFINFMILVFSLSIHDSDPKDLTLPVSKYPLLTADVYVVSFLIWVTIILIGKCIKRAYLLPYCYHFHVLTYLVWLILEFNLLAIDVSLPTLTIWFLVLIFVLLVLSGLLMLRLEIGILKNVMYDINSTTFLPNRIVKKLTTFGSGLLGLAVILSILLKRLSITFSTLVEGVGLLGMWIAFNLILMAFLIFMEFPCYLHAYYKWKYPEEYRDWEGKSLEDWYGKKYLKKHKELLKAKNEKEINL
ncbi:hypothetical protein [Streptococcus raffinosi]|uniref:Beta-carotene 15,15'-monooxygenase n=1 Tax=Streptococcus raffinosi TaxID=3053355 RepID=A0ABT7LRN8_9STRE|nr:MULTISPECIES: hypothetical protein [unclassified Streptococcus]MDL5042670.1 hypothetical protein [Streptococcus sp. VTCC 12812]MDM0094236.1 hypothetical protein [Streptococcus sp. VTCC 12813]